MKPKDRLTQTGPVSVTSRHQPTPAVLAEPQATITHTRIVRCPGGHPTAAGSVRCQVCGARMPA